MISGKDKAFVKGKKFEFPTFTKDNAKGKFCTRCGNWRTMNNFKYNTTYCEICNKKKNEAKKD